MFNNHTKTLALLAIAIGLLLFASSAYAPVIEFVINKRIEEKDIEYIIDPASLHWRDDANYARFYQDIDTKGDSFELKIGKAISNLVYGDSPVPMVGVAKNWNDKISSFELGACTCAIFCEHADYIGAKLTYRNVEPAPVEIKKMPPGWNDRVSSISVTHEPSCRGFSLSGIWKGGSSSPKIEQQLDVLTVNLSGRKYKGKILNVFEINVDFGPTCCTGQLSEDYKTIKWSNGTTWTLSKLSYPDLSGTWADGKAQIEQSEENITVNMKGRGDFTGKFISAYKIDVTFDSECCTGDIYSKDKIYWSNETVWKKKSALLYKPKDLTGTWANGKAIIEQTGNQLEVRMPGRHTFQGSYISANKIKVDFTDDRPCCTGTVVSADRIKWSNGSVWVKKK